MQTIRVLPDSFPSNEIHLDLEPDTEYTISVVAYGSDSESPALVTYVTTPLVFELLFLYLSDMN